MKFRLSIVTGSSHPIYKQLIDQVKLAISRGELSSGDQMPSVRSVAEELVINPNTVARAYGDLVKEGVLESRHGRGAFVNSRRQTLTRSERLRRIKPHLETFLNEAQMLGFTEDEVESMVQQKLTQKPNQRKGGRA